MPTEITNKAVSQSMKESYENLEYTYTRKIIRNEDVLQERRVVAHRDDEIGNVFRVLRSQIMGKLKKNNISTIAVVGSVPEVGKTMIATNLALAISQSVHHTVLLMDFDLRRPRVGWCFGIEAGAGVAQHLLGETSFEDILVNPGFDRLVVAPGLPMRNPTELLNSTVTGNLFAEVKKRYESRVVVVDLPPLLGVADALAVLPHIDAVLMVVEDGETSDEEIQEMKRLLGGVPILGAVVNKTASSTHARYYNYYYSDDRDGK